MSDNVKLGYGSPDNVSFRGEVETGVSREDWDAMSEDEKTEIYNEILCNLVDLWEVP